MIAFSTVVPTQLFFNLHIDFFVQNFFVGLGVWVVDIPSRLFEVIGNIFSIMWNWNCGCMRNKLITTNITVRMYLSKSNLIPKLSHIFMNSPFKLGKKGGEKWELRCEGKNKLEEVREVSLVLMLTGRNTLLKSEKN